MPISYGGPLASVVIDLQHIFGARLQSVVAYGRSGTTPSPCLVIVSAIAADDLDACAKRVATWHADGCATPLLITHREFAGSLDAFPIEYGEISDTRQVLFGSDPFGAVIIKIEDLRRECETLVKGHLVHLRENYIDCRGRPAEIAELVREAAPGFARLLRRLARLDGFPAETNAELSAYAITRPGLDARTTGDVLALAASHGRDVNAVRLYPAYLAAVERLWLFIDRWKAE